jgi:hypothetical protein
VHGAGWSLAFDIQTNDRGRQNAREFQDASVGYCGGTGTGFSERDGRSCCHVHHHEFFTVGHTDVVVDYRNGLLCGSKWRLPTVEELKSLQSGSVAPIIDPALGTTIASYYWSGTTVTASQTYAWYVSFAANALTQGNIKTAPYYARAVRSAR